MKEFIIHENAVARPITLYYYTTLKVFKLGIVAHVFNPSTWEAEASGFL